MLRILKKNKTGCPRNCILEQPELLLPGAAPACPVVISAAPGTDEPVKLASTITNFWHYSRNKLPVTFPLDTSKASLSEIETGKYKTGVEFLEKLVKKYNVNLYFVIIGEGDMFIPPTASSYARAVKFAVNIEDVRDFLYHFERSSILQYFILNQYKTRMMEGGHLIEKEIKDKGTKHQEQKAGES